MYEEGSKYNFLFTSPVTSPLEMLLLDIINNAKFLHINTRTMQR